MPITREEFNQTRAMQETQLIFRGSLREAARNAVTQGKERMQIAGGNIAVHIGNGKCYCVGAYIAAVKRIRRN